MLGPVYHFELITSSRRARYFVARTLYPIALMVALWFAYDAVSSNPARIGAAANVARRFFTTFSIVQLLTVLLLAPAMTAGTIAMEHERRTIEYLLSSQLSVVEIVLSKLAARLSNILLVLIAGVPVLWLASLLGGIRPEAIVQVSVLTLATLLAVVSLSMAISVRALRSREAVVRAYIILAALMIVPPLLTLVLGYCVVGLGLTWLYVFAHWFEGISSYHPFATLWRILADGSPNSLIPLQWLPSVWKVSAVYGVFSLACIGIAVFGVRRTYLKAASGSVKRRRKSRFAWRPPVWPQAMLWKELIVERSAVRLGWVGRVALIVLIAALLSPLTAAVGGQSFFGFREYVAFANATIGSLTILLIAARSASSITGEKERDCWIALLVTPLRPWQIIGAKVLGNLFAVRWLMALLAALWIAQALSPPGRWLPVFIQAGALLALACWASLLGLACSVRSKTSVWAMTGAIGTILFVGGGYLFCCIPLMAGPGGGREIILAPCVPYLLAASGSVYQSSGRGVEGIAFLGGLIMYGLLSAVLWDYCTGSFDFLNERLQDRLFLRPPIEEPSSTK